MSLVCSVVGARPNFMKIAPVIEALNTYGIPQMLVHTGQHYDANMSQVFFDQLGLPRPDIYLNIGSDTQSRQTARIMIEFEAICLEHRPDLVIVCGDVNSTVAAALVAAKLNIPVAHIESGLRSFDRLMPEEVNRVVTDHLSDLLFTTESSGDENLLKEGIPAEKIHLVGNCMVDTLFKHLETALQTPYWEQYQLTAGHYGLLTLHRPSNVDQRETLAPLLDTMNQVAEQLPLLFPVHPRTLSKIKAWELSLSPNIQTTEPLSYLAFIALMKQAKIVLTDSGGIQEETTALKVPCLTLRWNTERPITTTHGTNQLVGTDAAQIIAAVSRVLEGNWQAPDAITLWDGNAGQRIGAVIQEFLAR